MQKNLKKSVGRLSVYLLLGALLNWFAGNEVFLGARAAGFGTSSVSEGFLSSEDEGKSKVTEEAARQDSPTSTSQSTDSTKQDRPSQNSQSQDSESQDSQSLDSQSLDSESQSNPDTVSEAQSDSEPDSEPSKISNANTAGDKNAELPTAVVWYLEMAKNGDAEAQYNLGTVYETGFGVAVDKKEAARWYEKAAEHDHNMAQLKLGIMYVLGDGIRQSMIKGSRWIRTSADNGNEFAKNVYEKLLSPDVVLEVPASEIINKVRPFIDLGPKKSSDKLVALMKKEEKKKDKPELKERFTESATNTLGKKVDIENNVPQFLANKQSDPNKLESDNVALLQREANAGNSEAQFQLGRMYETGEKLGRDTSKAMAWFSKAAGQGHAESQYRLAIAHLFGVGTKRNLVVGEDWLTKAAKQNHPVANKMLPMYLANKAQSGTVSIALSWYLEKAVEHFGNGEFGLGHMYENGWGVSANFNEARKWYAAARTDGSGGAAKRLRQIKATRASNEPDPDIESAPKISEVTREQFASTLKVAGTDSPVTSSTNIPSNNAPRTISGSLPTRSKNQPTSFSESSIKVEKKSEPVISTATVTRRSPLTPIILIVFGVILGMTVFKWMRRGSYKKARYRQPYGNNQAQFNKNI